MKRLKHPSKWEIRCVTLLVAMLALFVIVPWTLTAQQIPEKDQVEPSENTTPNAVSTGDTSNLATFTGSIYFFARLRIKSGAGEERAMKTLVAIDPNTGRWSALGAKGHSVRVSSDGTRAAFATTPPGRLNFLQAFGSSVDIWSCSTHRGEDLQRVATFGGFPVWSPDNESIIATQSKLSAEGKREMEALKKGGQVVPKTAVWANTTRRVNIGGNETEELPIPSADAVDDWSPDGKWLVTTSDRHAPFGRGYQLYLMRVDGSEQRRLTRTGLNVHARFSPDGQQIVYIHQDKGHNSVRTMNIDNRIDKVIVEDDKSTTVKSASWSPDGRHLVIELKERQKKQSPKTEELPRQSLVIVDTTGKRVRELTLKHAEVQFMGRPDWR